MNYEIVVFKGSTFAEGARLCLKHRLYVPNWRLLPTLQRLIRIQSGAPSLAVSFVSGIPISLVLNWGGELMGFTRVQFRRKGHGTACLKALTPFLPERTHANEGIEGSMNFWQSACIPLIIPRF